MKMVSTFFKTGTSWRPGLWLNPRNSLSTPRNRGANRLTRRAARALLTRGVAAARAAGSTSFYTFSFKKETPARPHRVASKYEMLLLLHMDMTTTVRKGVKTRQIFMDAARRVFVRDGYLNAEISEIAKAAGK